MKKTIGLVLISLMCATFAAPLSAFALSLDQAKGQGLLGEEPTGYLGAVKAPASPEAKALMTDINQKRRKKYEEIAKHNGTAVDVVEQLAGKKAMNKTPAGQFVKLPSGAWQKK